MFKNVFLQVIDVINSRPKPVRQPPPSLITKKLQEDEDDSVIPDVIPGTDIEFPSIVPMIFKIVGSALSLNSSALSESSYGLLPERVSSQITNVLGNLANNILGIKPTTPPPPPRRRRRTTTTMKPVEDVALNNNGSVVEGSSINGTDSMNFIMENENRSTTTEVLFKESSLGESPVYAAAYAPNYIQTTNYPVYASNFLHVLYPAPTTTPTTTTTSEDPGSFGVSLPFDYQVITEEMTTIINKDVQNVTDYAEDYDYEEGGTEDSNKEAVKQGRGVLKLLEPTTLKISDTIVKQNHLVEDEDDEYKDSDSNTNHSLGRVGRFIY